MYTLNKKNSFQNVTIKIKDNGIYLNGDLINKTINLQNLKLNQGNKLTFTLGNKAGIINEGGFNLFGKNFGDYPQDIELITICE